MSHPIQCDEPELPTPGMWDTRVHAPQNDAEETEGVLTAHIAK